MIHKTLHRKGMLTSLLGQLDVGPKEQVCSFDAGLHLPQAE